MAKRGLGSDAMSPEQKLEIHKKGGRASGSKLTSERASTMGKEGAKAQPVEAKRRGGMNSHRSS